MMDVKECILCGAVAEHGILLMSSMICPACEQLIVSIGVDEPGYGAIIDSLKKVWTSQRESIKAG